MDNIKEIWANGEDLAKKRQPHAALLDFSRAKALLLLESKILYDDKSQNGHVRVNLWEKSW